MTGFSTDSDELRGAAARLHALVAEYLDQPVAKYWLAPDEVGDADLASALAEFQQVSIDVLTRLPVDVRETADRLTGNAERYDDTDNTLASAFRRQAQGNG